MKGPTVTNIVTVWEDPCVDTFHHQKILFDLSLKRIFPLFPFSITFFQYFNTTFITNVPLTIECQGIDVLILFITRSFYFICHLTFFPQYFHFPWLFFSILIPRSLQMSHCRVSGDRCVDTFHHQKFLFDLPLIRQLFPLTKTSTRRKSLFWRGDTNISSC